MEHNRRAKPNGHPPLGRGRGKTPPQQRYVQVASKQPQLVNDSPTSEMQLMMISQSTPSLSLPEHSRLLPVKRPDNGGTSAIRHLNLFVNHFSVGFNPRSHIFQYDVDMKLAVRPKKNRNVVISKPEMRAVKDKLFSDYHGQFPLSMTAYDGEKSIYSALELPDRNFRVEVSRGEDCKPQLYEVNIKQVKKLELCKLEAYLTGRLQQIPREILQGMDVVMKENATRHRISIGQGFYPRDHNSDVDLRGGIVASKGYHHTLKPTSQGLALCVDYSVLPLRKPLPVKEFLEEHLQIMINAQRALVPWEKRDIVQALKGLKVTVTHRKTKQQYRIEGLTRAATMDIKFTREDPEGKFKPEEVNLVDYFWDKYKKKIEYKNLPSLDLSKNKKMNYVPMEFCVLVEGQRFPKEDLLQSAANILKHECLAEPKRRMQVICDIVKLPDGPCGGDIAENFEISVTTEMTKVVGRVIKPPDLKLGDSSGKSRRFTVDKEYCHWNLVNKSVLDGKRIDRWAVLDFTSADHRYGLKSKPFTDQLMGRCNRLGIQMSKPLFCIPSNMNVLANTTALRDLLKNVDQHTDRAGRLQILVCVMTRKDPGYKSLKRISETEIGIMTQCCLVNHANVCKDIYLGNLALKINAKLGGSNMELFDRLPHFEGKGHVMFIGADVNHPGSGDTTNPSIAAVVATTNWPAANRYAARIRPQHHRKEQIQNFGEICLELVNMYSRLNKARPEKIVVFRDGVGDNQFDMVLNEELRDLKNSFSSDGYSPTITLVVAQKRHQTRFFPQNPSDVPRNGNVFPGTVVDTEVIHPYDFDFYMCSHYGSLGTSRPTRYTVLYDDHRFTSDEMQKFIYNMCYTFARCTKPVSLVPPVYYADLVAYRGRLYHEALMDSSPTSTVDSSSSSTQSQLSTGSSSSSSSASGFDSRHFKLHSNLENQMFFC